MLVFCFYPCFHFKKFGNSHRFSQSLPLTTHPNIKTTSALWPANSIILIDRGRMPREHLWLTFLPPKRAGLLLPCLPASKAQHDQRTPALMAGWGLGTMKNKVNRSSLLVRISFHPKMPPKLLKNTLFKKNITKGLQFLYYSRKLVYLPFPSILLPPTQV